MNSPVELRELLGQWRELTELEGDAIRSGHWGEVAEFQARKKPLQAAITEAAGVANERGSLAAYREKVTDLIALERRNADLIIEQRNLAEVRRTEMNRCSRNLRQVRQSYVRTAASHWQSYS